MSIVQRRPAPLAGSRDPYRSAPGARNDRYQDSSYQSSSRNNPPPSAMPRSSNASAGIPSRSRSYSTASASDSLPGNPRRPAGMPSGPSSSRYANTSANNNNGYESDATAPRSRRSDIPARGRAAAPEGGNRARSASVGPASAPSRPSRSSARRSPEAEYETGDAYADQNTYSNRDAGGYNDAGGTSDVTGYADAAPAAPDASSFGGSLWQRVTTAVGSLTITVATGEDAAVVDPERTPMGAESRITTALKSFYITRAQGANDLPDWLFSPEERRAAGGGKASSSSRGGRASNERASEEYEDYGGQEQEYSRSTGILAQAKQARQMQREGGYPASGSGSGSRGSAGAGAGGGAANSGSRFKQMRDAKRGVTPATGSSSGGNSSPPPPSSRSSGDRSYAAPSSAANEIPARRPRAPPGMGAGGLPSGPRGGGRR